MCVSDQMAQLREKETKWLLFLHSTRLLYSHSYTPLPSHVPPSVFSDSIFTDVYCSLVYAETPPRSCSEYAAETSYVISPSSVEALARALQDGLSHPSLQDGLSHPSPYVIEIGFMPAYILLQPLGVIRRLLRVIPSLSMTTERSSELVTSLISTLFSYLSFLLSIPHTSSRLSLFVAAFSDALLTLPPFHLSREQYRLLLRLLCIDAATAKRVFGILAVMVVNDPSSLESGIGVAVMRSEEDMEAFFASVRPECVQAQAQAEADVRQLKELAVDCESEEELIRRILSLFGRSSDS